jgi:omega-6 fatty acid desaturase (delta-12 desaturase)
MTAASLTATPKSAGASRRPEKDLLVASKAFTVEVRSKSWSETILALAVLAALVVATALVTTWPLRLALSLVEGLVLVRVFCLFHDYQHGAILRNSRVAQVLFWVYGQLILTPVSVWKETHNYHHAHTAKIVGSHIGSYPVVTTSMWRDLTPVQRFLYRATRHPLNVVLALFTVFAVGMCVSPVVRHPAKHWSGLSSLAAVGTLAGLAAALGRLDIFVYSWLIPMWLAAMSGAYLFYAQHNYPDGKVASRQDWTFSGAALDSSSFMAMGPVMNWVTANIGYHHVHHLNAAIPFYRLPEAMSAIPELQHPGVTTLSLNDIAKCFRLKIWDAEQGRMVGYP